MEKPRPSPNFGKLISIKETLDRRAAIAAGSSVGSNRMTSPSGEGGFATTRRSLISVAIDSRFEGFDAEAMHDVDEALGVAISFAQVEADQLLHHVRHFGARERGAEHLADRRARTAAMGVSLISADLDLVPLLAV